jgi:hypothetical protein
MSSGGSRGSRSASATKNNTFDKKQTVSSSVDFKNAKLKNIVLNEKHLDLKRGRRNIRSSTFIADSDKDIHKN